MEKAKNTIVDAPSDHVLRAVHSVIEDQTTLMANLNDRYEFRITESKLAKIVKLVYVWYDDLKKSMLQKVVMIAAFVKQLYYTATRLDHRFFINIFISLNKVDRLRLASVAIERFSDEYFK